MSSIKYCVSGVADFTVLDGLRMAQKSLNRLVRHTSISKIIYSEMTQKNTATLFLVKKMHLETVLFIKFVVSFFFFSFLLKTWLY